MENGIKTINLIRESNPNDRQMALLDKMEEYVYGLIDSQDLIRNLDDVDLHLVYRTLNHMLNYTQADERYFIEMPRDMYLRPKGDPCLYVGTHRYNNFFNYNIDLIGPYEMNRQGLSINDNFLLELRGNFTKFPEGGYLDYSDWLKIVAKIPNLPHIVRRLMKIDQYEGYRYQNATLDDAKKIIDDKLEGVSLNPQSSYHNPELYYVSLDKDTLDSIEVIVPQEYVGEKEVKSGAFGTYSELLSRINTKGLGVKK